MEAKTKDMGFDIFTSAVNNVEIADSKERAILIIPLMHVGPNKKGLYWTASLLKKIAPMFRSLPFRYDLDGKEGSSHTLNKLSSPHFDVGWTYSSEDGAWYDDKTKSLWIKGEVTHPEVIAKLSRTTTDGKREVNFASMGVIVEEAKCSICGADFDGNVCDNGHERGVKYPNLGTAYKVPTKISKALHAALTNDPADGEAEIKSVVFQELGYEAGPHDKRQQAGEQMEKQELSNQMSTGMAPASSLNEQPGAAPSSEDILKNLAERIKTIEQKISVETSIQGTPEIVNSSPQDRFTQSNMGTTTQFEAQKQSEENKMTQKGEDPGQYAQDKVPVNPKPEVQEASGDAMSRIEGLLQEILKRLPGAEVQDMGKESLDASKQMAKKSQEEIPTSFQQPGEAVPNTTEEGNKKNKKAMTKPGEYLRNGSETADNSEEETEEETETETADNGKKLMAEVADLREQLKAMRSKMEVQDNDIPEFGGTQAKSGSIDVADLGADGRREQFGDYGSWDAIFNGTKSAMRFKR